MVNVPVSIFHPSLLPPYLAYGKVQHAWQKDIALVVHIEGGQEGEGGVPPHLGRREGGLR